MCPRRAPNATNTGRDSDPIQSAESSSRPALFGCSNYQLEPMTLLKKFMTGQIALWVAFWLIGTPLAVLSDLSGSCSMMGCGFQDPAIGGLLLALIAPQSTALPFASFAIWPSAKNYPQN